MTWIRDTFGVSLAGVMLKGSTILYWLTELSKAPIGVSREAPAGVPRGVGSRTGSWLFTLPDYTNS